MSETTSCYCLEVLGRTVLYSKEELINCLQRRYRNNYEYMGYINVEQNKV